ncbi:MAG: PDZ domain-containing protein, partial [Waterburya sp.]
GKADHPFLGIQMAEITPELKQQLKNQMNLDVSADKGILIVDVVPNSPADNAGLKSGDIIKKIAGESVKTPNEVQQSVEKTEIGNQLALNLQRDDKRLDMNVKVGVLPES